MRTLRLMQSWILSEVMVNRERNKKNSKNKINAIKDLRVTKNLNKLNIKLLKMIN